MRVYTDCITLNPPNGAPADAGAMQILAWPGDPNGLISGVVGDRIFDTGSVDKYVCSGGTVWVLDEEGGGGETRTAFKFRPLGLNDPENGVYTAWADCHAAAVIGALSGFVDIVIDNSASLITPPTITAGTFNMRNIRLVGIAATGFSSATVPTATPVRTTIGTVFTNWTRGADFIELTHVGTAALYAPTLLGLNYTRTGENSKFFATTTGRIWRADVGVMVLQLDPGTTIPTGSNPVIEAIGSADCIILFSHGSSIESDTLAGSGDISCQNIPGTQSFEETQTAHSGTLNAIYQDPGLMGMDPAVWASTVPVSMNAAILRLAAALSAELGTPIP